MQAGAGCRLQTEQLERVFEEARQAGKPPRRREGGLGRRLIRRDGQPDQNLLAFADRQAREIVGGRLGGQDRDERQTGPCELRRDGGAEALRKRVVWTGEPVHTTENQPRARRPRILARTPLAGGEVLLQPEKQDIVGIDHGGVGGLPMGLPDRPAIEGLQRPPAALHVGEAAQPDETFRVVEVPELADQGHADLLLALDEFAFEQIDEFVPPAGIQGVLAQFDHRHQAAVRVKSMTQLSSHVSPPS